MLRGHTQVKIWVEREEAFVPLAVLKDPHGGQPVNSVKFLTSPQHATDHTILITAGPLNREVKIWSASASEDGWLLPPPSAAAKSWWCTQTLELQSSAEPEDVWLVFFNQVLVLPHAGLILLANAENNAIYAVHIEYGSHPAATCMDHITEFNVSMPILSLTSDTLVEGDTVQVYCVQTHAIQQYALDLCQCLPPHALKSMGLLETYSNASRAFEDALDSLKDDMPGKVSESSSVILALVPQKTKGKKEQKFQISVGPRSVNSTTDSSNEEPGFSSSVPCSMETVGFQILATIQNSQ